MRTVNVLQELSPQIWGDRKLPGARAGMLHVGGGEDWSLHSDLIFVPDHIGPYWIEWRIRDLGGELVQVHGRIDPGPSSPAMVRSSCFGRCRPT